MFEAFKPDYLKSIEPIGSSLRTEIETENLWFSWWKVILFIPPGKILLFSPQISHFWTENTFFLILFSRREEVGNTNLSIFPVPLIQLSPIFVHMVLVSHPTYPAKNFLIESPLVYFLVCVLIKITILVEISSWAGRRELPICVRTHRGGLKDGWFCIQRYW